MLYSPDGTKLAYVSDESGREEVYVVSADGAGGPKKVTDLDTLKSSLVWSPDSKSLAFTGSDGKLYTVSAEGKDLKVLAYVEVRQRRPPGLVARRPLARLLPGRRLAVDRHLPRPGRPAARRRR